ncbi:hemerythrin domain-containing protein [Streptomyces sp. CC224B]|uniref:hemerythrin domain-containing protein n=1 Tax=Streptomyces sp. CC224B TaxID=3044571 RepID=UPI0024A80899|nr:hemerythrin domain-containing protein [Streptomyces sp. CC224B]
MSRTSEDQSAAELGGPGSVLARQRRDHAEMNLLMEYYQSLDPGQGREKVLKNLLQLVFSHAFAEETVLWPAVRRHVVDGEELTALVEAEHQQINDLTTDIERLPCGAPGREEKVRQVFALIRQDIRDEEDQILPRLQVSIDPAALRRLGAAWEAVRRSAPTHPHPAVPRRPPGNALMGLPLSCYDRARDAIGTSAHGPTVERALAGLAGILLLVTAATTVIVHKRLTKER